MKAVNSAIQFLYKNIIKKILFLINPETIHEKTIAFGKQIGEFRFIKSITSFAFSKKSPLLNQYLFNIQFLSPVGLAAGFDYNAELTQILPCLGFGFGTVGTLTNDPYIGNPRPMLGRLPKSRSLMVNKGFKNIGIGPALLKLRDKKFNYPVGVSIGKTNTQNITSQERAVDDVVSAFKKAEESEVPFAYYELNISCPNLFGSIEFYTKNNLEKLLTAIDNLKISRPIFVKMPISKTDEEILSMVDIIIKYPRIRAVIFGNLQSDRSSPLLDRGEVKKFPQGNFSGFLCKKRSNELIRLVFEKYGSKIKIIGCGGVFSSADAYQKIKLGATLVQLITGLIFEGPQLVSQINEGLDAALKKDGYTLISQAVGVDANC